MTQCCVPFRWVRPLRMYSNFLQALFYGPENFEMHTSFFHARLAYLSNNIWESATLAHPHCYVQVHQNIYLQVMGWERSGDHNDDIYLTLS